MRPVVDMLSRVAQQVLAVALASCAFHPCVRAQLPNQYYGYVSSQGHVDETSGSGAMLPQDEAEAACADNGGHLASMHSNADHITVTRACNDVSETGNCWIGLNDVADEGTFVWTDGSPTDYEHWNPGEPV